MYYQWIRELALWFGSLGLSVALLVVGPFPGTWIGQWIGGHEGYEAGLDIGVGLVAFPASGMVLHALRFLTLQIYWNITVRTRGQPTPYRHAPLPSRRARRVLTSSDWDALLQLLCAVATAAILLWTNP